MKPRNLLILCVLCAAIAVVALMINRRVQKTWHDGATEAGEKRLFPDFPINDVARIELTTPTGSVTMTRTETEWVVAQYHDYPANFANIATLLQSVLDLKSDLDVDVAAPAYGRLELNPPDSKDHPGTRIRLLAAGDRTVAEFILGKPYAGRVADPTNPYTDNATGRYLLIPATHQVVVVREPFQSAELAANEWIDRSFLEVGELKSAELQHAGKQLWRFVRSARGADWTLDFAIPPGKVRHAEKLRMLSDALRYTSFSGIADPATPAPELGFAEGYRYSAETWDGFTYILDIGTKRNDGNFPVKVSLRYTPTELPPPNPADSADMQERARADNTRLLTDRQTRFDRERAHYKNWIYILPTYLVDKIIVQADEFYRDPTPAERKKAMQGTAPVDAPNTNLEVVPSTPDALKELEDEAARAGAAPGPAAAPAPDAPTAIPAPTAAPKAPTATLPGDDDDEMPVVP